MRVSEAADLIRPAVPAPGGVWADFGAGTGVFTRALARLVGSSGEVLAIDRDADALAELRRAADPGPGALVVPVRGDFQALSSIAALNGMRLDGALFANSLHFAVDPGAALRPVAGMLRDGGGIVVVEYRGRPASPWVPFPLPPERLASLAQGAGLRPPRWVGERPSRFGGTLYCARLDRA